MSRCVLVAESDATELELIATVLARDGFRVLQALERDQAMTLFVSEEIALVIAASDVSGRGGGAALCSDVKKQKPETRFVILHPSGNDPDARSVLLSRTGCDAVLPTPFRYDALKRLLGEWGLAAPPRPAAVPMSFAVPPPDVTSLVAAPSVESLLPAAPAAAPMLPPPIDVPIEVTTTPAAVPIPIPVVFPAAAAPALAEYSGDAEETKADEPRGADALDDEPTVKVSALLALQAIDDEPTVDARGPSFAEQVAARAEAPMADEPTVKVLIAGVPIADRPIADRPIADGPIADRPIADRPIADRPIADGPIADGPIADGPIADGPIADRPIADGPIADRPIADRPIADGPIADGPIADGPIADSPIADGPPPSHESLQGAWLLAPPPADSAPDGFAGLDLSAGLDSAVDRALDLQPTAHMDLLSALDDDAARSVALAVQAYVAESMAMGDAPLPEADAPALPPLTGQEPPAVIMGSAPELPPIIEEAVPQLPPILDEPTPEPLPLAPAAPPALPQMGTQSAEPPPVGWQVTERGTHRIETDEADAALAELLMPPSKGWDVVEIRREPAPVVESFAPPPAPEVQDEAAPAPAPEVAAAPPPAPEVEVEAAPPPPPEVELDSIEPEVTLSVPPPPPVEVDRTTSRAAKGASSWSPAAPPVAPPRALPQPVPGFTPATPAAPPPPPAAVVAVAPPAAPVAPPPPPREALHEPPALPFEAIVQRTPIGSEPRTTLPPSVPPEGDLATTPLPRLLFELYGGTYCGTLRLSRKGVDRIIDVWNGFPVAVTVTPPEQDDDLATLLRDHGRITPEQYKDAKRRANGREAQLLVALGIIDERDLLDAIREQTELRMAASFSWRDGTYKVTPSRAPPDSVVLSEVHPVKIIWRGVCEHYDVGSLLAFFSPLRARYIVATEVFPIHYETLGPFLRSVGVAHLLNGQTTFEQALRSDDSHALTIAHTLYVLIVTEMIRAQSRPGEAATFPDAQAQTRQSKPVDYRELTQACEEVARTYLSLKERDYFEMLQLSRQATEREVAAAYDKLAKPFKVENLLPGLPDDVHRRAREIDQLLRRARDTLSSPEERRRYVTRLEDNQPPPPPADAMAS